MKFYKLNSNREVNVPLQKYRIDWDKQVGSKLQKKVKDFLYPYWVDCECLEEFRLPGSLLRLDLVNLTRKVIVEVSPEAVHGAYNKFFHKTRGRYLKSIGRDFQKVTWAERNGFQLIELIDDDIKNLSRELFLEKFQTEI